MEFRTIFPIFRPCFPHFSGKAKTFLSPGAPAEARRRFSTPNMTGRGFHRTTEAIPRRPWKAKRFFVSRPIKTSIKKGTRGVHTRYDTALLPFISIALCPGRPVIPVPEIFCFLGGKCCGKFGGNFVGFFRTHQIKAQKCWGNFRNISRESICASKIFRANFVLQTCHPRKSSLILSISVISVPEM